MGLNYQHLAAVATAFALGCSSVFAQSIGQSNWPSYQGNMNHTGYVDVALVPTANVRLRWRTDAANPVGNGFSGVAIGYGRVYTTPTVYFNSSSPLIARDLLTGAEQWRVDFGSVFSVNPPALDDSRSLYLVTGNHGSDTYLRSYDAESGQFRWRTALTAQWETYLAPTIVGDEISTNSGSYGGISSVRRNGTLRFFTPLPQYDDWTPTPWRNFWLAYTNQFDLIDRVSGAISASITIPNYSWTGYDVRQAPVVIGDVAFITNGGRLIGINLENRTITVDLPINATGQVSTDGENLYLISNGTLSVRSPNGEPIYAVELTQGSIHAPVIVTRTHVIANAGGPNGSSPSQVVFVDRSRRAVTRTFPAAGRLALAADTLIIAGNNGEIFALDAPDTLFADGLEPRS